MSILVNFGANMTNIITKIMELYKEIARLHHPELKSTEEMPNWISSYTQILQLRKMQHNNQPISSLQEKGSTLLHGAFAEVSSELPRLVSDVKLKTAFTLYTEIRNNLILFCKKEPSESDPMQNYSIK